MLALAGGQAAATLARTPVFNPSLQRDAPNGGTIPMMTVTLFDRAAYYTALAEDWSRQAAALSAAVPGVQTSSQPDDPAGRAAFRRARDAVRESLRHSPGDGASWMLLAKVEAGLGVPDAALTAWERSRQTAPYRATAALDRLYFLVGFMIEPEGRALALARISPAMVGEDLAVAETRPSLAVVTRWLSEQPNIRLFLDAETTQH